jgi:hypothetical protein
MTLADLGCGDPDSGKGQKGGRFLSDFATRRILNLYSDAMQSLQTQSDRLHLMSRLFQDCTPVQVIVGIPGIPTGLRSLWFVI